MRQNLLLTIFALPFLFSPAFCEDQPVKIAAIFAKTGIAVANNAPHIQVSELAVDQINSQGGVLGRPVELIVLDNKMFKFINCSSYSFWYWHGFS